MNKYTKKSLGQNFLIDNNIKKKIIKLVNFKNRNVIEVGPGNGALTKEILKQKPKSLTLIEKDDYLSQKLKETYKGNKIIKNFTDDILNFDLEKLRDKLNDIRLEFNEINKEEKIEELKNKILDEKKENKQTNLHIYNMIKKYKKSNKTFRNHYQTIMFTIDKFILSSSG